VESGEVKAPVLGCTARALLMSMYRAAKASLDEVPVTSTRRPIHWTIFAKSLFDMLPTICLNP
jgi:hypothetical protein